MKKVFKGKVVQLLRLIGNKALIKAEGKAHPMVVNASELEQYVSGNIAPLAPEFQKMQDNFPDYWAPQHLNK